LLVIVAKAGDTLFFYRLYPALCLCIPYTFYVHWLCGVGFFESILGCHCY